MSEFFLKVLNNIDWTIIQNNIDKIYYKDKLDITYLTEDIFQAEKGKYIIDIGWYGDIDNIEFGIFKLYLIEEYNWEQPIVQISSNNIELIINLAVATVNYFGSTQDR